MTSSSTYVCRPLRCELAAAVEQMRIFRSELGQAESTCGADRRPGCCTALLYRGSQLDPSPPLSAGHGIPLLSLRPAARLAMDSPNRQADEEEDGMACRERCNHDQ